MTIPSSPAYRPNDEGGQLPGSYPPAPPAPPTPPKRGRRIIATALACLAFWGVGLAMGYAADKEPEGRPLAAATPDDDRDDTPARPASSPATTEPEDDYVPTPADFQINVVELSKACFGTAGCNVTFTIELGYGGPEPLDPSDSWQVIYDVTGGESVRTDTATVNGTAYSYSPETMISTGSEGAVLTATPTLVRLGP